MRKLHLFSILVALSLATTSLWAKPAVADENGKLPLKFSVASNKQVYFSQGNLQYQASTNTWRFAENQYDYVGDASKGNVYENAVKCNNANISQTYTGWIDLFGWGTKTNPWNTSSSGYSWNEWGENAISNGGNVENFGWYTMTSAEWAYLLGGSGAASVRTCSSVNGVNNARCTKATILTDGIAPNKDIQGLIIFPDCYGGGTPAGVSWGRINPTNNSSYDRDYPTRCTTAGWKALEAAGCVFLPSSGRRNGTTVRIVEDGGPQGCYTSSTAGGSDYAYWEYIHYSGLYSNYAWSGDRPMGRSVRLVKVASSETYPPVASVAQAPSAIPDLVYSGSSQALITAGIAGMGTMMYRVGTSGSFTPSIPTATNAGTYNIYYYAGGDCFTSSATQSIEVTIAQADYTPSGDYSVTGNTVSFTNSAQALVTTTGSVSDGTIWYKLGDGEWMTSIPTATDMGDYHVYYKIVPTDPNYKSTEPVEVLASITVPTVTDHSDAATINAVLAANPTTLKLERTIYADDEYNTICLPFALNESALASSQLAGYNRLKAFRGAQVSGTGASTNIDIFVEDATAIEAGVPYLISYPSASADIVNPVFSGITVSTTEPGNVEADGVTFQGMFAQVHIDQHNGTKDYLFLGENSQLYWPLTSENGDESVKMRGFRAYFIIDRNAIPAHVAPRGTHARFVNAPQIITSIIELDANQCTKFIENGQLIILKNGIRYNAQGQIVK